VPPTGVLLSWLLLGEPLTVDLALGGALVLGGVALAQTGQERRRGT
jgi:drug/metabolite transporter (DMT)-like permease